MNECIHAGWTTGIPPGQELDGSVSHKKKRQETKSPVIRFCTQEGLHVASGSNELKCPALLGADGQVKQTEQRSE